MPLSSTSNSTFPAWAVRRTTVEVAPACFRELFEMFPPGQQAKADQMRANLEQLETKYAAGVAHWNNLYAPDPGPPPVGP